MININELELDTWIIKKLADQGINTVEDLSVCQEDIHGIGPHGWTEIAIELAAAVHSLDEQLDTPLDY